MGPIVVLKKNDYQVKRTRIEDTEAEVKRVDEALKASQEQLQKLYDKAVREVGEASAAIFEVHQMMLEDEDYLEAIQNMIRTERSMPSMRLRLPAIISQRCLLPWTMII